MNDTNCMSMFRKQLFVFACDYLWPSCEGKWFRVSSFCTIFGCSRSSYYRIIVPELQQINRIRLSEGLPEIPLPHTFDYRRFLINQ